MLPSALTPFTRSLRVTSGCLWRRVVIAETESAASALAEDSRVSRFSFKSPSPRASAAVAAGKNSLGAGRNPWLMSRAASFTVRFSFDSRACTKLGIELAGRGFIVRNLLYARLRLSSLLFRRPSTKVGATSSAFAPRLPISAAANTLSSGSMSGRCHTARAAGSRVSGDSSMRWSAPTAFNAAAE